MRADAEGQTALRLRQGAQRAEKLDRAVPGRFVTGMERQEAQREAKGCSVLASFDGGWDDAERVQVCFHPDGVDAEFTAVWLEISWAAKFARVGHSDLLGSLMARCGEAKIYHPGGCRIGKRPIDLHLKGLERLGFEISEIDGEVTCRGSCEGGEITLPYPSVGATENLMMAALAGKTDTILRNCATEPEVADLAGFLRGCGFTIYGGGTETIFIKGAANAPRARQKELRGETTYFIVEDRVEAATYLMAALGSGGRILLRNTRAQLLTEVLCVLRRMGAELRCFEDLIELRAPACLRSPGIVITAPYPGFPTDCQPQLMSLAAAARGLTTVREEIFENRFTHKKELSKMGADIEICGKNAIIKGTAGLQGCDVTARDLRGGAALVLAGLMAEGRTRVSGIEHIDRGYEALHKGIRELGGVIERRTT